MNKFLVYAMRIYIFCHFDPFRILSICLLYSFITFTPSSHSLQVFRVFFKSLGLHYIAPRWLGTGLIIFHLIDVFVLIKLCLCI